MAAGCRRSARRAEVRKLWAQTLVVDPTGAAVDLTRIVRVDLVSASTRGRVWVADLSSAPATLAAVPDRRLPTINFSRVRIEEGAGGAKTARVPFQVTGDLTAPARFSVLTVGQARGDVQRFSVDLAPGQTGGSVPVGYVADRRADYRRLVTQVTAWATRNVMTDGYLGELAVVDDDPRPRSPSGAWRGASSRATPRSGGSGSTGRSTSTCP